MIFVSNRSRDARLAGLRDRDFRAEASARPGESTETSGPALLDAITLL